MKKLSESDKKKIKIREVLRENPQGITPKQISLYSKVNRETTKRLLKNMPDVKNKDGLRGYYILDDKCDPNLFDCKIENLRFSFSSDKINIAKYISETNSLNDLIKFRFVIGAKSKKATMSVGTKYPLDFSCLCLLGYLFQTLLEKHCNLRPDTNQIMVTTFEINKDYFGMTLEGCNSIKLDTLLVQYKLYHKEKKYVREEYKIKQPIPLSFLKELTKSGLFYAETNKNINNLSYLVRELNKKLKNFSEILIRK